MSSTLYPIKKEYSKLIKELEVAFINGDVDNDLAAKIVIKKEELGEKAQNYRYIMEMMDSHANMAQQEIDRVTVFKKLALAKKERLKKALLEALLLFGEEDKKGIKRLEFGTVRLSTHKSVSTNILDESEVSEKYRKVTYTVSDEFSSTINDFLNEKKYEFKLSDPIISKTDIKKDIDGGVTVAGAELDTKYSLTIK